VASGGTLQGIREERAAHPLGQNLIVTAGCGYVQSWGGPVRKISPGDVVTCPPGEKHWYGASQSTAMTHIAVQEALDGKMVDWMEKVSDQQYEAGPYRTDGGSSPGTGARTG